MAAIQKEQHRIGRIGWLRAAVLGANDGILSTASLVLGVATAHATHTNILTAGVAGLVAGAMAMAAGEYVSVHSQADTEQADLKLERKELKTDNKGEHEELAAIYVASDSGCIVVGRELRGGSGLAAAGYSVCPGGDSDSPCFWHFIGVPCTSGRAGCARGRGRRDDRRAARHVLGRTGHGCHRRGRSVVRNGGVTEAGQPARVLFSHSHFIRQGRVRLSRRRWPSLPQPLLAAWRRWVWGWRPGPLCLRPTA